MKFYRENRRPETQRLSVDGSRCWVSGRFEQAERNFYFAQPNLHLANKGDRMGGVHGENLAHFRTC
jgi:hypothetical protein